MSNHVFPDSLTRKIFHGIKAKKKKRSRGYGQVLTKEQIYSIGPRIRKQWIARGTYKDNKPREIVMTSSERP